MGTHTMIPDPTWILRITHVDNLSTALQQGGICAPNTTLPSGIPYKPIHHQHIQNRRSNASVPCGPRGTVHDYVPFYFAPRSPMLYAIYKGNVAGYSEGQEPLIYLVANAQEVARSGVGFVFTDGHAAMAPLTDFYDDLIDLDRVDWTVMRSKWWNDTPQTPDRRRRRQAEFMIHRFCPWPLIQGVAVMSDLMRSHVEAILSQFVDLPHPIVKVKRLWYY